MDRYIHSMIYVLMAMTRMEITYRSTSGYCVMTKTARVLSSVHAIFSIMTSAIIRILHINGNNKWPRDFNEPVKLCQKEDHGYRQQQK